MPYQTDNLTNLENVVHEQLSEMRTIRMSLESMEKMMRKVYEVTEGKALSFARRNQRARSQSDRNGDPIRNALNEKA